MPKKPQDYEYYTMKLPLELKEFFERYIKKNTSLGYKTVSQLAVHILQKEAKELLENDPDLAPKETQDRPSD